MKAFNKKYRAVDLFCGGFRMLQNHELATAQGFPRDYYFHGTKAEVTKQIGNAVPPGFARAITESATDA